jgi:hypothetical protein
MTNADEVVEKAKEIVEFHIGDCSCEQDRECRSCAMQRDIVQALSGVLVPQESKPKPLEEKEASNG